jgi:hypothetical protein
MSEPAERRAATPDEVIAAQRNRQVLIATIVIAVLAGLIVISRFTDTGEEDLRHLRLTGGTQDAPAFARDAVAVIEIRPGTDGEPFRIRRDGDDWRVEARFDAPASATEVSALLTKVFDATRMSRPATVQRERYALYRLEDERAARLRLLGDDGRELLHLLVGRGETGARDFVRLAGPDAPEGMFELSGPGGAFDTLYSRLNLTTEGRPEPRRWLDLSGFRPLPFGAVARGLTLVDGARVTTFERRPGSLDTEDEWDLAEPRARADGAAVRGLLDTLSNLPANDIAGRMAESAAEFGLDAPTREVRITYTDEGAELLSVRLAFGRQQDNRVAVHLTRNGEGELIYWCSDYALARLYRPTIEFMDRQRLRLAPDGVTPELLRLSAGGVTSELLRVEGVWRLADAENSEADSAEVNRILLALSSLQGYAVNVAPEQLADHELGPGLSPRVLDAAWPRPRVSAEPGENGAEDELPPQETVGGALYFGRAESGEVSVLRRVEGRPDQVFRVAEARADEMFADPRDLKALPEFEVKVLQILVSWKGRSAGVIPKDPERGQEQALELVQNILERARAEDADFGALQEEFNEDTITDYVYTVNRRSEFVKPFKRLAAGLEVGQVDYVLSQFGYHILKRIE